MAFSEYMDQRILYLQFQGYNAPTIVTSLQKERMVGSMRGIAKFLKRYEETCTIARCAGSGRPTKITGEVKQLVVEQMRADDKTTAYQLHALLTRLNYSLRTILRCRKILGWTFRGSAYCQLIRCANKEKRLDWARRHLHKASTGFHDVVWTDECTIQLEIHRCFCCRKQGERPKNKPR